jgi:oligopeptide/dipeptide ABC transporter ATP-binding protein
VTFALEVAGVSVTYRPGRDDAVAALRDVSLTVRRGRTLALVGESGSGKTTLARVILGLERRESGVVRVDGIDVAADPSRVPREVRKRIQPLFQDPGASLDPMWRMRDLLIEAMDVSGSVPPSMRPARIGELLLALGLADDLLDRRVHELSGGQKQRFALARALATGADMLVLDEPLTALDPPAQRAAMDLFATLKRDRGVTTLLVSHDLDLVRTAADDVVVLYRGRVVESGPTTDVLGTPRHPYTRLLLASVMPPNPAEARRRLAALPEDDAVADPVPSGCAFAPRCPLVVDACRVATPDPKPIRDGAEHAAACPVSV